MAFLRAIIYLALWIIMSVILGALVYPFVSKHPPYTECLSDPLAFTPGASRWDCQNDYTGGVAQFFDRAYRAGYVTIQTAVMLMTILLACSTGLFLTFGIYHLQKGPRRRKWVIGPGGVRYLWNGKEWVKTNGSKTVIKEKE